jgi:hypothetical protein
MNKYLVTLALFLVFGTSAYMSIYGLTAVFSGMVIAVICMGASMECGKILAVVYLHRNWGVVGWIPRIFFIVVISALTLITSMEVLGFLTQRHVDTTRDLAAAETKILELDKEATVLRNHIAVIDKTLAGLPAGYVTKRFREREAAGYDKMRDRLLEIVREVSKLKRSKIADVAYSAPIFAASRIFGLDPDKTISVFVLFLVAVLEPLSIGLAVATSNLWQISGRTAEDPAEIDEAANETVDAADETAKESAETADPYTIELREIAKRHKLKTKDIAEITDRKQPETIKGWLEGKPVIPIKALRLLRRWTVTQLAIGLMRSG